MLVSHGHLLSEVRTYTMRQAQLFLDAMESRLRDQDKRMMLAMRVAQASDPETVKSYMKQGEE